MKILTLYYSKSGHTKKVAEIIHEAVGGDIGPIRTKKNYARSYVGAVIQGGLQRLTGTMPELLPLPLDLSGYDVVFLGGPVWWFTIAPALRRFLMEADLSGKRVYPFLTSGGQPKDAFQDLEEACGDARVGEGFHVYFKGNQMMAGPEDIKAWAAGSAAEGVEE